MMGDKTLGIPCWGLLSAERSEFKWSDGDVGGAKLIGASSPDEGRQPLHENGGPEPKGVETVRCSGWKGG
jgi:hypothetical protein